MSGMLIDSIMGTIDHIYCDNTIHVITEQNHQRNTIVRRGTLPEYLINNGSAYPIVFRFVMMVASLVSAMT